ncbi:MAG: hypothetical protein NTU53_05825 [Planctomycetota bacterium]|nr:hypothetical protein [Planctomycetota bacterium]
MSECRRGDLGAERGWVDGVGSVGWGRVTVAEGALGAAAGFGLGGEGGGEFFVECEEEFDALAFGGKGLRAVAAIDGGGEIEEFGEMGGGLAVGGVGQVGVGVGVIGEQRPGGPKGGVGSVGDGGGSAGGGVKLGAVRAVVVN